MPNTREKLRQEIESKKRLTLDEEIKAVRKGFGTWYLAGIANNLYKRSGPVR